MDNQNDSWTKTSSRGGQLWSFAEMKTAQQNFELLKKRLFASPYVRYIALIDGLGNTIVGSMKQGVQAITLPDQDFVMNLQAMVALGIGESNQKFAGKLHYISVKWNKIMDLYFLIQPDLGLAVTLDVDAPADAISELGENIKDVLGRF